MTPDALATNLAARQGGVVLTDQALECGFTTVMIRYRVRTKRWQSVGSRAYRVIEMAGPGDFLRAAVTALPGAVASHQTAASLHSFPMVQSPRPTVMVHSRTTHTFPGVVVHRCHDLDSGHVTDLDGLPVTTIARTAVDLAAVLSRKHVERIVDDLVAARRLVIANLQDVYADVAQRGKPGSAAIRSILEERVENTAHPQSRMESRGLGLLIDAGLPRPEVEYPIPWDGERRFDLAFPEHRLAIEWDSWRWHSQLEAFERDRRRDRLSLLNGWRVLRFTWADLEDQPAEVVRNVRNALGI